MSRPIPPSYKTKNWPAYNDALKQRGSLTIWFDPDMVWVPPPTGKRGRQPQYSDAAIQTCLTMKVLFGSKRYPMGTRSQLDVWKFQGRRSSMRRWGWPPAMASRVALR